MDDNFVSMRIAQLRTSKDVSARDMSLTIGQNENYISQVENGKNLPSMQVFFYICEYFEISPSDFFLTDTPYPAKLNELVDILRKLSSEDLDAVTYLARKMAR